LSVILLDHRPYLRVKARKGKQHGRKGRKRAKTV
jgi:hypothetical protein